MQRAEYRTSHNAQLCEVAGLTPRSPPGGSGRRGTNSASSICPPHGQRKGGCPPNTPPRPPRSAKPQDGAPRLTITAPPRGTPPQHPGAETPPAKLSRFQLAGARASATGLRFLHKKAHPRAAPRGSPVFAAWIQATKTEQPRCDRRQSPATRGRGRGLITVWNTTPKSFCVGDRNTGTPPQNRPTRTPLVHPPQKRIGDLAPIPL
jgi:hypothetical protein